MNEAYAPLTEFWGNLPPQPQPPAPVPDIARDGRPEVEASTSIAPIDVARALKNAVCEADRQGLTLRKQNDRYIVSRQSLSLLAPEIAWDECRYKIEQMAKANKLKAIVLRLGDDTSPEFAIAFKPDEL